ncbi:hypothetical protein KP509_39G012500 [Ceratopteris richardii]|uniref:Viral late gene transcription factor 3 zinc ribbon domain-containing protein n=1 Tax=Ceratopteris richardii TaxID=49495 RepID=A0A8T2PYD7_CERRI|nr:hypothetical protein KP509_39G012500 [Ceratopteris richardii]
MAGLHGLEAIRLPSCGALDARRSYGIATPIKRSITYHQTRAVFELGSIAAVEQPSLVPTWQVAVGAVAGITPFVVAGIEFSKRIAAQRKCTVCGGSGLVKREEYYFRCYSCGGFLPWQSWKRFFSGK